MRFGVVVLEDAGRGRGDFSRTYDPEFETIVSARARVTLPDGTEELFGREKFEDELSASGVYSSNRVLTWSHGAIPLGSIVEWEATFRESRPELFAFSASIGNVDAPTMLGRFEVIAPESWELAHLVTRAGKPISGGSDSDRKFVGESEVREGDQRVVKITGRVEGGLRHLLFESFDVDAFHGEPEAPPATDVLPRVWVRLTRYELDGQVQQTSRGFVEFSKALHQLHEGTAEPSARVRAEVARILEGVGSDPVTRSRKLFEWVQREVRYVAIEVGMGGWRPHSAEETFASRAGDCKDKATLLRSMLRAAGVDSHPASINLHGGLPRPHVVPNLGTANHMILAIDLPKGLHLVDPTSRTASFEELPAEDQGAEVVLATKEGVEPIVSPESSADANSKHVEIRLELSDQDEGAGQFRLVTSGQFASDLAGDLLAESEAKQRERAKGWLWLSRGNVAATLHREVMDPRRKIEMEGRLTIPRVVGRSGSTLVFRLSDVIAPPGLRLSAKPRTQPIVFQNRVSRSLDFRIRIPTGLAVTQVPDAVALRSEFGTFEISWTVDAKELAAQTTYRLDVRYVDAARSDELRAFFESIRLAYSRGVLFKPSKES